MPALHDANKRFLNFYSYKKYYEELSQLTYWKKNELLIRLRWKMFNLENGSYENVCISISARKPVSYGHLAISSTCRCSLPGIKEFACDYKNDARIAERNI